MTWRTILAAVVFIGMCGFIAYWGDLLGRRLGKRRLSLFGLRPRYTAIVFTTVTGMLIAVFTIAFMATISQRVRLLMLEGEKILRDRDVLIHKYEVARRTAEEARAGAIQAKEDARRAIKQRDVLIDEIRRISVGLQRLRINLLRNEAALARTEKLLATAQRDLTSSHRRLASAAAEIEERRKEISQQREEISTLEAQRSDLVNQTERLNAEMDEAVVKYQRYIALRQRPIVFRSNEELARAAIDCTQPKLKIHAEVLKLLDKADQAARDRGSRVGDNNRAVKIITKKITGPDGSAERTVTESASIDALVDEVSTGSGSVVLRVVSIGNSVEGEQALVEFVPNYNRLVYWKDQDIAETRIDGSASRGQILGQVISFLRTEVRPAAVAKGVIPYFDEEQDQPSVGTISPDQLLDIVDRIKSEGKPVTVRAHAQADTWSAGPLDLEFRIEAL